jgi:Pyrimidine dimer DNA glycosylase
VRLWSLHPEYLDQRGLVALWREALLAQAVLAGQTKGYTSHPQLIRFRQTSAPLSFIAAYLRAVQAEAGRRGYCFDAARIGPGLAGSCIPVTVGQLVFEAVHLRKKLEVRAPVWLAENRLPELPRPHPLFMVVDGGVEDWEKL